MMSPLPHNEKVVEGGDGVDEDITFTGGAIMSGHGENAADSIVADAINDEVGYHADGNEYIDSADNGFDESEVDRPEVNVADKDC
ncbi:hypothetical protein OIU76_016782 [Salix suchowensis]|nr:hypothetical protein OIU76_016782 [Salix suchowensis]